VVLSSRHVGLQGGCVGVGCLVSDTPGAPHAPHGVACSWTAAMQGMHRSGPPRRSRVDSPAHVIPLEVGLCTIGSRLSIPRRGPPARGGGTAAARLRSGRVYFRSLDIRLAGPTAVGPGTRDRGARWRALVVRSLVVPRAPCTFRSPSPTCPRTSRPSASAGRVPAARGAGGKRKRPNDMVNRRRFILGLSIEIT